MPTAPTPGPPSRNVRGWRELLAIDVRALAAFRIGLGLCLLTDLWGRARTLREHYTGEGVFPRELALELRPDSPLVRLFLLSDRFEVQAGLFVVFALVALALVLGWRTRLASVLAFVLLASLVRRNPYVCHTGDVLLKALCFWAMFLPLGAHLALDARAGRSRAPPGARVLSLATAGVLLQVALFYVLAGILKSRYAVWREGEAVWIFTHVVEYTRPFGVWLGQFPLACRAFTYATLGLEGLAPFLLFSPCGTRWLRPLVVATLALFHLTLQATIHIGIFQVLCIVMLLLYLPTELWDGLARRLPGRARALLTPSAEPGAGPRPGRLARWGARASQVLLVAALAVILVSNVNSVVEDPYDPADPGLVRLPKVVDDHGRMLSLVQSWNMFTDIEHFFFGWFLVLGQQEDGTFVDVLERRPYSGLRFPEHYARTFPNHNARRYWRELTLKDGGQPRVWLQKPMCDYLAREWTRAGRPPLAHLAIFHVGRVPIQRRGRDQVKPIATEWEAPHEPLRSAAPEVQRHWGELRTRWQQFLADLPRTAPARD
ncbi:MAG TPA: HTTM domain-containing protein [Planctomycetota bacterium]